jgi:two-component system chemotaxis sensor kinase CheA
MDDLIAEFLTETNESIAELDVDLVKLEQNPNDKDLLSKIFRVIHTVKGTCGFLGLPRLEKTAHKAEDVLGLFRDGALEVTSEYVTLIFESLDRIKYIVGEIEANGAEPEGNDDELIAKLTHILKEAGEDDKVALDNSMSLDEIMAAAENEAAQKQIVQAKDESLPPPQVQQAPEAMEARASNLANQSLRVSVDVIENLMTMVSELVLTRNQLL